MILFISDLHLSGKRPDKIKLFQSFMEHAAKHAKALYILGDLYEDFWLGCDDPNYPNLLIIQTLKNYAEKSPLYIMKGNRDFYLNQDFASATGCQLLADHSVIDLEGENVLIMHGDILCTDDISYQKWRYQITHPIIQWLALSVLPLIIKIILRKIVRAISAHLKSQKIAEIMDVNEATVIETMQDYNVTTLIHGHTHKLGQHTVKLNDHEGKRIVLGDWYHADSVLVCHNNKRQLMRIEEYLNLS